MTGSMIWRRSPEELSWMPLLSPESWEGWRRQLLRLRETGLLSISHNHQPYCPQKQQPAFLGLWHRQNCQKGHVCFARASEPATLEPSPLAVSAVHLCLDLVPLSCELIWKLFGRSVKWMYLCSTILVEVDFLFMRVKFISILRTGQRSIRIPIHLLEWFCFSMTYQEIIERGTFTTCEVRKDPKDTLVILEFVQLHNCKCGVTPFSLDSTLVHQE